MNTKTVTGQAPAWVDACLQCGTPLEPYSRLAANPAKWFCSPKCQQAWVEKHHPEWLGRSTGTPPEAKPLPSPDAMYGSDPNFTGGVESTEYLHQMCARRSGETP